MQARGWWNADKNHSLVRDPRAGAPAHHAWWEGDQDQVGAYLHGYDSLWLPAALLHEAGGGRLTAAVFAASRHKELGFHMNKGLAGAPADGARRRARYRDQPRGTRGVRARDHCRW